MCARRRAQDRIEELQAAVNSIVEETAKLSTQNTQAEGELQVGWVSLHRPPPHKYPQEAARQRMQTPLSSMGCDAESACCPDHIPVSGRQIVYQRRRSDDPSREFISLHRRS